MPSLSLSLEAISSTPDEKGNNHRVSIDALSSCSHNTMTTYKAQLYSYSRDYDSRDRSIVIVKFPKSKQKYLDSGSWAHCQVQRGILASQMAEKFNAFVCHACHATSRGSRLLGGKKIRFLRPQMAVLDSASVFNRKQKKGDSFVFEDIIDKDGLKKFTTIDGKTRQASSSAEASNVRRKRTGSGSEISGSEQQARRSANSLATKSPAISIPLSRKPSFPDTPPSYKESTSSPAPDTPPSYEESNLIEQARLAVSSHHLSHYNNTSYPSCPQCLPASDPDFHSNCRDHISIYPQLPTMDVDEVDSSRCSTPSDRSTQRADSFSSDEGVDDDSVSHPILQAFVHYFFCQNEGQAAVCNLKGCLKDGCYILTTPVIHTLGGGSFGDRDGGVEALKMVVGHHKCSWLCRQLPDMSTVLRDALSMR